MYLNLLVQSGFLTVLWICKWSPLQSLIAACSWWLWACAIAKNIFRWHEGLPSCSVRWSVPNWAVATNATLMTWMSWTYLYTETKKQLMPFFSKHTHILEQLLETVWLCFFGTSSEYPHAVGGGHDEPPEDVANAATVRDAVDKLSSGVACQQKRLSKQSTGWQLHAHLQYLVVVRPLEWSCRKLTCASYIQICKHLFYLSYTNVTILGDCISWCNFIIYPRRRGILIQAALLWGIIVCIGHEDLLEPGWGQPWLHALKPVCWFNVFPINLDVLNLQRLHDLNPHAWGVGTVVAGIIVLKEWFDTIYTCFFEIEDPANM